MDLYEEYAKHAGTDQDLASFFREVQQQEKQRADQAKQLLAKHLQQSGSFYYGQGPFRI